MLSVDWEPLATGANYPKAARNALPAGEHAGKFLETVLSVTGANLEDVHVVGFSLGAQAVAGIGQYFGGTLKRITGLDPAGNYSSKALSKCGNNMRTCVLKGQIPKNVEYLVSLDLYTID